MFSTWINITQSSFAKHRDGLWPLSPPQPSSLNTHPGVKLDMMISEVFSNLMASVILCPLPTGSQCLPRAESTWSLTGLGSSHRAHRPMHGHIPWAHTHTQLPGSDNIDPKPFQALWSHAAHSAPPKYRVSFNPLCAGPRRLCQVPAKPIQDQAISHQEGIM